MAAANYRSVLRAPLGDAGVSALDEWFIVQRNDTVTIVTESFERRLGEECGKLRSEMSALRTEMSEFRSDIRSEMKGLRYELRSDFKIEVANVRADLLKWSFVFWIGQVAAIVGLATVIR